jgi:flagellar hook-length control protein FliK
MQALSAVANTAGNVIPITGSISAQTDGITMIVPGEKRSFTDIFAQLYAMFPTAASANTVGQATDKQGLFAHVPGQKVEEGADMSHQPGNEAILAGIMLAMPTVYNGQPVKPSETGNIVEAVITESQIKPAINKAFAAPGNISMALTQMQPVTGALEKMAGDSNPQSGIGPTDQVGKILATTQPSTALKSLAANQPGHDKAIMQTGKGIKTIEAEIQPGNAIATAAGFSTDQVLHVPTSQSSKANRLMTAAGIPVAENAEQAEKSETAKLELKKAFGSMKENKTIVTNEQPAIESPHGLTSSGKARPVIDETARPADKENKNLASLDKQVNDTSVTKKTLQTGGDEVKVKYTATKKADMASSDTTVKLDLQPSLHNIQAATERSRPERTGMSKSQIDFIANHLAGQINSGTSSLEINLQPESLGKIQLMFQMDEGSLSVRIIAHAEETRNLLDASLQSIKESLSQQGIKVNDMSLDLAQQEKHGNHSGNGYREASKPIVLMGEKKDSCNQNEIWQQNPTHYRRLNILA